MAAAGNRRHSINSMKNKNADGEPLSIGRFIKQRVDERHITYAEFARLIHCGRTSLYHLFEATTIDVDRLLLISRVLDFDFFAEYYHYRPHTFSATAPRCQPVPTREYEITLLPASCLILPLKDGHFDFSALPVEVVSALRRQLSSE